MRRGLQATGWKETRGLVFFLDSWQRPDPLKGIMVTLSLGQQGDGRAAQNQASGPHTGAGAWTVTAPSASSCWDAAGALGSPTVFALLSLAIPLF